MNARSVLLLSVVASARLLRVVMRINSPDENIAGFLQGNAHVGVEDGLADVVLARRLPARVLLE